MPPHGCFWRGQPSWISKIHHGQNPSKTSSSANVADRAGVALMRVKISIRSGEEVMGENPITIPNESADEDVQAKT